MGHQHLSTHLLFPVLAYTTACAAAFQVRACTVRHRARRARAGRTWLGLAVLALAVGAWGVNVIALLGYGVSGATVRHDALPTLFSALVCAGSAVFGLGLADTAQSRSGPVAGGAVLTVGLTAAHFLGTTALDAPPVVFGRSPGLTAAAVALTAAAAAALLWPARPAGGAAGAVAPFLAAALLCAAQYTHLAAVTVAPDGADGAGGAAGAGLGGPALGVAAAAVVTLALLTVAFNLYVTPLQDVRDAPRPLVTREMPRYLLTPPEPVTRPVAAAPVPVTSGEDGIVEAGPVLRVGG
ncbi:hypothetical protein AB0D30_07830 [Streptomyces sp. NPDC048409]|uniref:hypothetical protein n=1 Tax=Streptomyces sp. NPDC048409 TaxID=3154723 RepID=UPI0034388486